MPAVADHHWSPYTMPESTPEGAKTHVIIKGDTLWDLAGKYLNNPYLWPQIWEANRYITDPHWIYPGDILVIPTVEALDEETLPVSPDSEEADAGDTGKRPFKEAADERMAGEEGAEAAAEAVPQEEMWTPSMAGLYCSPFIPETPYPEDVYLIGNEEESETSADGDIVYLNQGAGQGVQPGDMYTIIRNAGMVKGPDRKDVGIVYWRIGELKIIAVQEATATGRVSLACQEVYANDLCIPRKELPGTEVVAIPDLDRYQYAPSGPTGAIIYQKDDLHQAGKGDVVIISMGMDEGLSVGDFLVVFRKDASGTLPIRTMGQVIVLSVEAKTATCGVAESFADIRNGDMVGLP
jgi:hypothetical protein